MLVLARKTTQAVVLIMPDGRVIEVTVVELRNKWGHCRLGIDAPDDVTILRKEIINRGQQAE